jgi:hypothetical protein
VAGRAGSKGWMPNEGDRKREERERCREVSLVVSVVKVERREARGERRTSRCEAREREEVRERERKKRTELTAYRFHQGHRLPFAPPTFFSRDLSLSTTSSGITTTIPTGRGLATPGVRSSFALSRIGAEIVGREEG